MGYNIIVLNRAIKNSGGLVMEESVFNTAESSLFQQKGETISNSYLQVAWSVIKKTVKDCKYRLLDFFCRHGINRDCHRTINV